MAPLPFQSVVPGLVPGIHTLGTHRAASDRLEFMDPRDKPEGDGMVVSGVVK